MGLEARDISIGTWVKHTLFGSTAKVVGYTDDGRLNVEKINGGIGIYSVWNITVLTTAGR